MAVSGSWLAGSAYRCGDDFIFIYLYFPRAIQYKGTLLVAPLFWLLANTQPEVDTEEISGAVSVALPLYAILYVACILVGLAINGTGKVTDKVELCPIAELSPQQSIVPSANCM